MNIYRFFGITTLSRYKKSRYFCDYITSDKDKALELYLKDHDESELLTIQELGKVVNV